MSRYDAPNIRYTEIKCCYTCKHSDDYLREYCQKYGFIIPEQRDMDGLDQDNLICDDWEKRNER